MSAPIADRPVIVGGLGAPYDDLLAALLRGRGLDARALGALDHDAFDRGRRALSRNPCAPQLATTGALLRHASTLERRATFLGVGSCGPCRFALFAPSWRRALAQARHEVDVVTLDQDWGSLAGALGEQGAHGALDAIAAGDALAGAVRRLRPHLVDPDALEGIAARTLAEIASAIEAGRGTAGALAIAGSALRSLPRRAPRPLGRIALVGEPWSLHADGAPQLHLPQVLARAGVEVEAPPLSLWLALRAWELRQPAWGRPRRETGPRVNEDELEPRIRGALARACDALGLGGLAIPDLDALAERARPHHPPEVRGGYGHLEVALALRARDERRAHAVISVKSFGCIPSSGLSDAIVPAALAQTDGREGVSALPFLALEVSTDGEAARESRLMLRAAGALEAAEREVERAWAALPDGRRVPPEIDPLRGEHELGPRPYACTLACAIARSAPGGPR